MKKNNKVNIDQPRRFAVAPMIDWTDRHCRFFHRQMMTHGQLFTEMVVDDAILRGKRDHLLGFDRVENPVVLQLGGSDPSKLSEAAEIGEFFGYDEVNLNVGCPSDRVQSGTFGACLMRSPQIVERAVLAMKQSVSIPVTVKCRIGVDDQDPHIVLPDFVDRMVGAGADALWVHARKAWLQGLSPKQNRSVPPLDYPLVYRMKERHPDFCIGINGGITSLEQTSEHLSYVDGVMLGRAAYQNPLLLTQVDNQIFGAPTSIVDWTRLRDSMMAYAERQISEGARLPQITRHMVGLFSGYAGARRYRQILSTEAPKPGAGTSVIAQAFEAIIFDTEHF